MTNDLNVRVVVDGVEARYEISGPFVRDQLDKAVERAERLAIMRMLAGSIGPTASVDAEVRRARVEVLRRWIGDAAHRCVAHVVEEMVSRG